jgi:hypothetical protein
VGALCDRGISRSEKEGKKMSQWKHNAVGENCRGLKDKVVVDFSGMFFSGTFFFGVFQFCLAGNDR